ncbi:NfeD family protein [Mucisphaera calidilacus]|uniref:Uncharacterized protein n=1 Tax=Mucisphaera calidilacus TaxID=2527982 RepID=A0A518C0U6_9BACT|nr:NfeD family protein [Mucisphaera calidilacus]QDU72851.1 hypothetical protein Pan265_27270 [Mucisphaera calidilacus]
MKPQHRIPALLVLLLASLVAPLVAQTTAPINTQTATPARQPAAPLPSMIPPGGQLALLKIEGVITGALEELINRRIERALNQGAGIIVFDFDTPGGELAAALRISRNIKGVPVPTVAWINPEAYSAGILLASACDELVMATSASTGDAAPISLLSSNLGSTERAKALSPLLAEFRDNATRNGYDYAPFHAMCVLGVEVYLIENPETGQQRLVNQVDYRLMVHGSPSLARQVSQGLSSLTDTSGGVGNPSQEIATASDFGKWRPVDVLPSGDRAPDGRIHDGKSLLTVKDIRARDIRISRATIDTTAELETYLGAAGSFVVNNSWAERAALFMSQWWVRAILLVIFFTGFLIELSAPGLSLPGAVAVCALVGLFGSPIILGLASAWHIVLFLIGFALLVTDLLFLIGFGFLGAAGLAIMAFALIVSVLPSGASPLGFSDPAYWNQLASAFATIIVGAGATIITAAILSRYFNQIPLFSKLVLATPQPVGPVEDLHIAGEEVLGSGHLECGQRGVVASAGMRPSGEIEIDGQRIDAVTDGEFLAHGTPVRIVDIQGNRIVVERDDQPPTA